VKRKLLDVLADNHEFTLPDGLVDIEFQAIWRQIEEDMKNERLDEEDKGKSEEQLKKVIAAMPQGKLRVATVDAEHGRVIFTITADRAAVHAAVQPGDELRLAKDGTVEIAPTGIPGLLDQLGRAMEDLKKKWFGD